MLLVLFKNLQYFYNQILVLVLAQLLECIVYNPWLQEVDRCTSRSAMDAKGDPTCRHPRPDEPSDDGWGFMSCKIQLSFSLSYNLGPGEILQKLIVLQALASSFLDCCLMAVLVLNQLHVLSSYGINAYAPLRYPKGKSCCPGHWALGSSG